MYHKLVSIQRAYLLKYVISHFSWGSLGGGENSHVINIITATEGPPSHTSVSMPSAPPPAPPSTCDTHILKDVVHNDHTQWALAHQLRPSLWHVCSGLWLQSSQGCGVGSSHRPPYCVPPLPSLAALSSLVRRAMTRQAASCW